MSITPLQTYLKYLWRSTNQHGVHSPFVYDLVTKALRSKEKKPLHPATRELKCLSGLPDKYRQTVNKALHHLFGEAHPEIAMAQDPLSKIKAADLVCLDLREKAPLPDLATLANTLQNDAVLLVLPDRSRENWNALTQLGNIHLTIDCLKVGFAWKRAQQAKENFTIRL